MLGRAIDVDLDLVSYKGLRVTGSLGSIWSSWQAALQLLEEGKVVTAPLISETIPLAQWRRAFNMAKNKEGIKFLLRP